MEMEEEGIGLVLARATELRLKISNCIDCIDKSTSKDSSPKESWKQEKQGSFVNGDQSPKDFQSQEEVSVEKEGEQEGEEEKEEEEEAESLLHIYDALESLETQLAALQNLRQRQQYEKQAALAEIDYSRKMLLEKLKDYKGKNLEVIQEASAFAGEKVEYDNDLLLPPYPSRPPQSSILDNGYLSHLTSTQKLVQKGKRTSERTSEAKKQMDNKERSKVPAGSENSRKGVGHVISSVAKMALPIVGVICILRLGVSGSDLGTRSISHKVLGLFQKPRTEEKRSSVQCPPGKVPVVENGKARCVVKERVEIPFESMVLERDVNYGYG